MNSFISELAAAVRLVHLAAAVLLAGSFAFVALIARPALGRPAAASDALETFCLVRHLKLARWSLAAVIASALAALWVQANIVSGQAMDAGSAGSEAFGLQEVIPLLMQTLYGKIWLLRFALALGVAALLLPAGKGRADSPAAFLFGFALGACLLASIALAGHSASGDAMESALQVFTDVLHLLAAGAWLGGLVPLFLLLRHCNRGGAREAHEGAHALIRAVTRRYSRMAIVCVAILLATGGVNAWALVGGVPQLFGTPYGRLLLLKLALLLPLLGLAAVNLLKVNPGIAADPAALPGALPDLSRKLARNAIIEAGLGVLVLLIVALLGTTPPARHLQPEWPFAFRWDWSILDAAPKARAQFGLGFAWSVLGLFVLQFAFLSRHWRKVTFAVGTALAVYAVTVMVTPVTIDAYPTSYRRPEVPYQAISVANGKQLYGRHCIACHGASGYGDDPAAEFLRPRPADMAGRHAYAHSAGDLFWWLSNGIGGTAMPGFSASLAEDERCDLINFLRALAAARKARKLAPEIEDQPWLLAPDFAYASSSGPPGTLKDHRGEKLVLLVLADSRSAAARLSQLARAAAPLNAAGVAIIAVLRDPRPGNGGAPAPLPLVTEGNSEIHETYALFAGGVADATAGAAAAHVEYLIDKQGYIRARWLPAQGEAWRDPAAILRQTERLLKEKPRAPAPEEHGHE